jgi:alkylation response protein AidB-like acyl-CoA dehydrogenase
VHLDYTLRAEIRASLEAVMTPERIAAVADHMEGGAAVKECVRDLGAADLLGVGWPKEYGGQGFTALEQFIFFEEAQRVNAPIPLVTLNTVGPTLAQCGTQEQKQKFLPSILRGTVEFAIGYSEPSAGSDLASLRTTAERDGDDYIINGHTFGHRRVDPQVHYLVCGDLRLDPALGMGKALAVKVFGTERTQQVARELLEVLDRGGTRKGDDAPLRGALESTYRIAVINTFGGGANELQRDIIAMAGLLMPRAPRDLRAAATQNGTAN